MSVGWWLRHAPALLAPHTSAAARTTPTSNAVLLTSSSNARGQIGLTEIPAAFTSVARSSGRYTVILGTTPPRMGVHEEVYLHLYVAAVAPARRLAPRGQPGTSIPRVALH